MGLTNGDVRTAAEGSSRVDGGVAQAVSATPASDEQPVSLTEPSLAYWQSDGRTDDQRSAYLTNQLWPLYEHLVNEFFSSADDCVLRYQQQRRLHQRWRWTIIVGTGLVAILNALAALISARPPEQFIIGPNMAIYAAAVAAVAAAILAILANLENFGNHLERGQSYREARELFLDAARDFERLWQTHVVAFEPRPEALVNGRELYRRICVRDADIRRKVKDLTDAKAGHSAG